MTKDLSQKLRRVRRGEIIPIYYGIKRAADRAITMQPEAMTLVSVEKGVWEILVNDIRIGGVMGGFNAVRTAVRLIASKMGCEVIEEDSYCRISGISVSVFQLKFSTITPLCAKIVERRGA